MRFLVISVAFLLILFSGCRKSAGCEVFRNGRFQTTIKGRQYFIYRNGDIQIEYLQGTNTTQKFTVDWVGDCIYILKPDEKIVKQHPAYGKTPLVTVTITEVKKAPYVQTAVANFSDKEFTSEIFKVKN